MTTEAIQNEIIPVDYGEIDAFAQRVAGFEESRKTSPSSRAIACDWVSTANVKTMRR